MFNNLKKAIAQNKIAVGASALITSNALMAAPITAPDFSDPIASIAILLGAMLAVSALVWGARKLLGFAG